MGMADANKRINLAAPLISVRRHGGALPSYKPGEASGPLGHTGTVPFRWEHRPGHPKSVRTRRPPPTTVAKEAPTSPTQKPTATTRTEEERLSDDDMSCVTVNCSATGLNDAAPAYAAAGSRSSAMMERFLPAAHAVAVASPLSTFRKAGSVRDPARAFDGDRLPKQHVPTNHLKQLLTPRDKTEDKDDDAESDVHSTHGFASKRCGLLPTRCLKSTLLLLSGARRGEGTRKREMNPLLRRSRSGQQQQPRHAGGHDPDTKSWEELHVKSLLQAARGGLAAPAAAVASELDRTVRELYSRRRGGVGAVQPKASHLGLLLVLDRSNEACHGSSAWNAEKKLDASGYGFPLLLEDKATSRGREIVLSPQAMLPALPLPRSPSESWLSRALPSVSNRPPPATSFLGLHVQSGKQLPCRPWCSIETTKVVDHHARQRQIRFHDLQE